MVLITASMIYVKKMTGQCTYHILEQLEQLAKTVFEIVEIMLLSLNIDEGLEIAQ